MKKIWIELLTVAMVGALLTMPGTAVAKPGEGHGNPPKPPSGALYNVTLDGDLATTCGSLVMKGTLNGTTLNLVADGENGTSVPMLDLQTSMMGERFSPDRSPVVFSGCHGGSPWAGTKGAYDGTVVDHPGLLMIAIDGDSITFQVWHFDYWWEETSVTHGKKTGTDIDIIENFTMSSGPITMSGCGENCTGRVSGDFGIGHFLHDYHTRDYIGYEPVTGSPETLEFTITVAPQS